MYLEISGRQTGKTTRMINQIYADKHLYDIQILMGMNQKSLKIIKDKIKGNNKIKICLSFESLRKTLSKYNDKKIRLYVDEFLYSNAFINNYEKIKDNFERSYFLLSNGYFSSSMNSEISAVWPEIDLQIMNDNKIYSMHSTTDRPL